MYTLYLVAIEKLSFCAIVQCHSQDLDINVVKRDPSSPRRPQAVFSRHIFLFPLETWQLLSCCAFPDNLVSGYYERSMVCYITV